MYIFLLAIEVFRKANELLCCDIDDGTMFVFFMVNDSGFFTDINECTTSAHDCHTEAICSNTDGSFTCNCNQGYTGDGEDCAGRFSISV